MNDGIASRDGLPTAPAPEAGPLRELFARVREDLRAHPSVTAAGCHAVILHRVQRWSDRRPRLVQALLFLPLKLASFYVRNLCGVEIDRRTTIGRRVVVAHQSGIVIHPDAVIGDECLIRQNVTIGIRGEGGEADNRAPRLGRGVRIGAGAVLVGGIDVGDGAVIGPNAVVVTSVAAGARVVAPPAREWTPRPQGGEREAPGGARRGGVPAAVPDIGRLVEQLRLALANRDIDADTPLLSTGLVDSLGVVILTELVEAEFGKKLRPADVDASVFDTPAELASYVSSMASTP